MTGVKDLQTGVISCTSLEEAFELLSGYNRNNKLYPSGMINWGFLNSGVPEHGLQIVIR